MEQTGPAALETAPAPLELRPQIGSQFRVSLFWRTFFLLALLLLGSVLAWLQTFRVLETEPRSELRTQQIASVVNLSRAALVHSDAIARIALIKQLAELEGIKVINRLPSDTTLPLPNDDASQRTAASLRQRLGKDTLLASAVNGQQGLWVGLDVGPNAYWLLTDPSRSPDMPARTWLVWLLIAAVLSIAGAALIARLINRPLKALSFATSRLRDGDFYASRLDEKAVTSEVREVNKGFNRMAEQLSKVEQDRAIMLAGISHDLRTPLARLRLETELSVADETARAHMAADIEQLDGIIDKFLDYARPDHIVLESVVLNDVITANVYPLQGREDVRFKIEIQGQILVRVDGVELSRVFANLIENARKYGRTTGLGMAEIDISAKRREDWVLIRVRDHGPGVSAELLPQLTKPFFRGDAARTEATGAGLGLAIVERTVARMGGVFVITNTASGGLAAHIRLRCV